MWDSGDVLNANGNTFSLYLLPAQPPGTFAPDSQGVDGSDRHPSERYADLCAAEGLRPITTGDSRWYPSMTACAQLNCMPVGDEDYDGNNGWGYIVNGVPPGLGGWDHGTCWEPGLPHSAQEGGDAHHFTGISDQTCWNNLVTLGRMPRESPSTFRFGFDQADPTQWDAPLHPVCGLEHDGLSPPPPVLLPPAPGGRTALGSDPSTFWDSGNVVNANGNTFSLYLLPAQPPGTFGDLSAQPQRYVDLCAAAGLRPVVSGDPHYWDGQPSPAPCGIAYECMPMVPTANTGGRTFTFIRDSVGWDDNYVTIGVGGYEEGLAYRTDWDTVSLHPLCGLEHDGSAPPGVPPPPAPGGGAGYGPGGGGKGR